MPTEEITIRVDSRKQRAYRTATEQDRRKLDLLLSLPPCTMPCAPDGSLKELMRNISRQGPGARADSRRS